MKSKSENQKMQCEKRERSIENLGKPNEREMLRKLEKKTENNQKHLLKMKINRVLK